MSQYHYGLKDKQHAYKLAHQVCVVLGHGKNRKAVELLLETAAAETQLGTHPDTYAANGFGLCQFDKIGVMDVQQRTNKHTKELVYRRFGVNIDGLGPQDLANDPLISLIFCRLKYRLIPDKIPSDIISRAAYWKRHYNTEAGKGTVEHYIESAERHLYGDKTYSDDLTARAAIETESSDAVA